MDGVKFSRQMDGCFFFPAALSFFLSFFLRMSTRTWEVVEVSLPPPLPAGLVHMCFCFGFLKKRKEKEKGSFIVLGIFFWDLTSKVCALPPPFSLSLLCVFWYLWGRCMGFPCGRKFLSYIYIYLCTRLCSASVSSKTSLLLTDQVSTRT